MSERMRYGGSINVMQRGGEVGMQWLSNNWGRIKWVWCSVGDGETSVVHSPQHCTSKNSSLGPSPDSKRVKRFS